jgi:hypothetical protein
MNKLIKFLIVGAFSLTINAEGGLSVITINTDDAEGYVAWLKENTPVFTNSWGDNVASSGICSPVSGAEQEGNHYVWNLGPTLAATMSAIPGNDADTTKAIRKISKKRSIERRDIYEVLKQTSQVSTAGQKTAQYNLLSIPSNANDYVEAVKAMESAAADNGFADVEIAVFSASGAGDRAGMVMASVQAPSMDRLGLFLGARNSGWMSEAMKDFGTLRTPQYEWLLDCEVVYSN